MFTIKGGEARESTSCRVGWIVEPKSDMKGVDGWQRGGWIKPKNLVD
jgi:hypothetical protein